MQIRFLTLVVLMLLCFGGVVHGQTKVVVVPLMESDQRNSFIGVSGAWNCAITETCQDVYEFTIDKPANAMLDLRSIGGSSVVLTAIFAPGQSLSGTNLLTGSTADRECTGQNVPYQLIHLTLPTAGRYKLAIGRDWGSSSGLTGTYQLRFYTSVPHTYHGQTVSDSKSQASGTACPPLIIPSV
ncbi:hypothetical protein GCM10008090_06780 [Arenicella chitinivorans]|uniref:Peptidase C-terminal archaeal/bacterial domain-containing protein n=1 Tax=Arenicella chitinivorans TaxID=1329800 RepID=A0A918RIQ7_9GAMM|nr:hypothetical protein [Arenicella chitinivorans]GHA00562.1 hypothetical protein GCM10008090_06780 [Arenicella chitinivorans]